MWYRIFLPTDFYRLDVQFFFWRKLLTAFPFECTGIFPGKWKMYETEKIKIFEDIQWCSFFFLAGLFERMAAHRWSAMHLLLISKMFLAPQNVDYESFLFQIGDEKKRALNRFSMHSRNCAAFWCSTNSTGALSSSHAFRTWNFFRKTSYFRASATISSFDAVPSIVSHHIILFIYTVPSAFSSSLVANLILAQRLLFLFDGNSSKTVFWSTHCLPFKRFERQSQAAAVLSPDKYCHWRSIFTGQVLSLEKNFHRTSIVTGQVLSLDEYCHHHPLFPRKKWVFCNDRQVVNFTEYSFAVKKKSATRLVWWQYPITAAAWNLPVRVGGLGEEIRRVIILIESSHDGTSATISPWWEANLPCLCINRHMCPFPRCNNWIQILEWNIKVPKVAILRKWRDKVALSDPRFVELWFAWIRSHVISITSYHLFVATIQVGLAWDHRLYCLANHLGLVKRLIRTIYEQMYQILHNWHV